MDIQTNFDQQQASALHHLREAFNRGLEEFASYIESLTEKKQDKLLELLETSANWFLSPLYQTMYVSPLHQAPT